MSRNNVAALPNKRGPDLRRRRVIVATVAHCPSCGTSVEEPPRYDCPTCQASEAFTRVMEHFEGKR